jgi:transcriptional regulator with XRE-family HTH domain
MVMPLTHRVTPLRRLREERGISAEDLARAVESTQSTISRIENARRRPSPDLALRIEQHFKNAITRDQVLFPEKYMTDIPELARKAS